MKALAIVFIPLVVPVVILIATQQPTFKASVDVVAVPVSVTHNNVPVPNLTPPDFELFDNGVRQDIAVTPIVNASSDVTFLIDVSGSVDGSALERVKNDLQEMSGLLQPNDRQRLITFAGAPSDAFGFVPGNATLDLRGLHGGGATSLYDSLVTVLAASSSSDRPHLIFAVTDGRDNSSFASARQIVEVARLSSALLCLAIIAPSAPMSKDVATLETVDPRATEQSSVNIPGGSSPWSKPTSISRTVGPYTGGPNLSALNQAASATGGFVYSDASGKRIPDVFRNVLDIFRAGYNLTYSPNGVEHSGTHILVVRAIHSGYIVRARKSYEWH